MQHILLMVHIVVSLLLLFLVMIQKGIGDDAGASFGAGSANTWFGGKGPAPFLSKCTGILVVVFFLTSLGLGYLMTKKASHNDLLVMPVETQHPKSSP